MSTHLPDHNQDRRHRQEWSVCALSKLPSDFRRMLSIQFREFVHYLEDAQSENDLERNPRVINFLERCYYDEAA